MVVSFYCFLFILFLNVCCVYLNIFIVMFFNVLFSFLFYVVLCIVVDFLLVFVFFCLL